VAHEPRPAKLVLVPGALSNADGSCFFNFIFFSFSQGDPKQTVIEGRDMVKFFFVAVARECRKETPTTEVTSEMVRQHLAKRAFEEPFVAVMLMWVRYMDIVFMMEESGKDERGDHALFQQAQRMSSSLLAMTNAFKYIYTTTFSLAASTSQARRATASSSTSSCSAPRQALTSRCSET